MYRFAASGKAKYDAMLNGIGGMVWQYRPVVHPAAKGVVCSWSCHVRNRLACAVAVITRWYVLFSMRGPMVVVVSCVAGRPVEAERIPRRHKSTQ